jgi:uncharacterized linocin/CFP29 family protein
MADSNMQLQWTDEQWNKVRQVVYEEARRARVAGNFLPLYGPLEPDARFVSDESIQYQKYPNQPPSLKGESITVDDSETLKLSTIQVEVFLRGAQIADPELTSALTAFRRAANVVARLEDEIIFNGQPGATQKPTLVRSIGGATRETSPIGDIVGGDQTYGLLAPQPGGLPKSVPTGVSATADTRHVVRGGRGVLDPGETLVGMVSKAIGDLEGRHQLGPFACVLGQEYFTDVQTPPARSSTLPQDRILPFLGGGALLRTSTLPNDIGLVVALGGEPIDLVVGTDISVKFLQVTLDPWYVFRVYEKVVLRIKQPDAIAVLHI